MTMGQLIGGVVLTSVLLFFFGLVILLGGVVLAKQGDRRGKYLAAVGVVMVLVAGYLMTRFMTAFG